MIEEDGDWEVTTVRASEESQHPAPCEPSTSTSCCCHYCNHPFPLSPQWTTAWGPAAPTRPVPALALTLRSPLEASQPR